MMELLAGWQQAVNAPLFSVYGLVATRLELLGFVLALAMVVCNILVNPWAWPLAISSSLLYGAVFWQSKLYGEASLQVFFVGMALWGWSQWLWAHQASGQTLAVRGLSARGRIDVLVAWLLLWPVLALFLGMMTDTDVPWWDAFTTSGSVVGTWLLGRKLVENWFVWVLVNAASVGLFAYKGLWFTVVLYAVFLVMALFGWREWRRLMHPSLSLT